MLGPSLHKFVKFKNIRQINSQYLKFYFVKFRLILRQSKVYYLLMVLIQLNFNYKSIIYLISLTQSC